MNLLNRQILEVENHISSQQSKKFGLLEGYGGVCLFYFYLARLTQNPTFHDHAMALLSECIENIDPRNGSYCSGMSGLGQLLNHLVEEDFVEIPDQLFDDLDYKIKKWTILELKKKNLDFLYGACGSLFYLLNRSKANRELCIFLEESILKIDSLAIKVEGRTFWQNWDFENNCINTNFCDLGIAHGQISIVYLLSKLYSITNISICAELVESSLKFLKFASGSNTTGQFNFPYYYNSLDPTKYSKSRLGWCYGDLATSVILGQIIEKHQLSDFNSWLENISKNNLHLTRYDSANESSLCHGFASCSLLFSKLASKFPNYGFETIAENYLDRILTSSLSDNIDMLDGLSGIGLFLISQREKTYNKWSDLILINAI